MAVEKVFDIRPLSPKDYDSIISVWERSGLPHRPGGRDGREHMAGQLERDSDLYLGAFEGDDLVGVVIGTFDGRKGYINRIAVVPESQRKGIGMALLRACEDALRARGSEVISTLIEIPNDPSVGFFRKAGYYHHDDIIYLSIRDRPDA
jgi:ribosomal protein S18 acetylase RimI-like enzyme